MHQTFVSTHYIKYLTWSMKKLLKILKNASSVLNRKQPTISQYIDLNLKYYLLIYRYEDVSWIFCESINGSDGTCSQG